MNNNLFDKEKQVQALQDRVEELEHRLLKSESAAPPLGGSLEHGAQTEEIEERFRLAIQVIPFPFMIHREDGKVVVLNESWTHVTGFTLEDIPTVDDWTRRAYPHQILQGGTSPSIQWGELQVTSRRGDKRVWDFCTAPLGLDRLGWQLFITMAVDITERKRAEEALAESERRQREITRLLELDQARLAAILQHLPVGVWIADQHGRLIGSNEQADRIWAGETPLMNSMEEYDRFRAWHSESGKPLQPEEYPMAVALRTGQPVAPIELQIQRFDGSIGTVLASAAPINDRQGQLTGVVGVNVDITEHKKAQEALRHSEERFEKAFHATPDAIIISRMSDGLILEVNEGWKELFGHEPADVIGKTSLELGIYANPADRQDLIRRLEEKGFAHSFELQVRCKSGAVRHASMSVERLDINGTKCLLTIMRDITEGKHAGKRQKPLPNMWSAGTRK